MFHRLEPVHDAPCAPHREAMRFVEAPESGTPALLLRPFFKPVAPL